MKTAAVFLLVTIVTAIPAAAETARVAPAAADTVRTLGAIQDLPILGAQMQSSCLQIPQGTAFRRGFAEFDVPVFPEEALQATLVIAEARGWVTFPVSPVTHELSWYPADLRVTVSDYAAAATLVTLFQTQYNLPPQTFRFDVTDIVNQSFGRAIGFRMNLRDEPSGPCSYVGDYQGTAFFALPDPGFPHLEVTLPTTAIVPVDIVPRTCPNPLSLKSNFLAVAIAGDPGFDALSIDPSTVRLEGVAPIMDWPRDIATPFAPNFGKRFASDCNTLGKDGEPDLLLRFETRSVLEALQAKYGAPIQAGALLNLRLTGNLSPALGGFPILGEDVVVVEP